MIDVTASEGNILIVDDNPTNIDILFHYLDDYGYNVFVAADGEDAIKQVQLVNPDIILLDVMMPGIDGFETCRRIKLVDSAKHIPVIFMTALADTTHKVRGFEIGAVDYITKPFQYEEMLARVKTHLTIRTLQKALQKSNEQLEERVIERTAALEKEIIEREAAYAELNKVQTAYSRFVPKALLRLLDQENIADIKLGDQTQMDMTILFADICAFTSLTEKMSPADSFNFINAYLQRISPIIREHGGFIDKYIGDSIMALFPGEPSDALHAAINMLERLAQYNFSRQTPNRLPIRIGIGLHTGRVTLGTIGEEERLEGTVISDAVNLASRLQDLTRVYDSYVIISGQTFVRMDDPTIFDLRLLDRVKVKGKAEAVAIFEVLDGFPEDSRQSRLETRADFEKGVLLYHYELFKEAAECFQRVLNANPADQPAQIYLQKALSPQNPDALLDESDALWQSMATMPVQPNLMTRT